MTGIPKKRMITMRYSLVAAMRPTPSALFLLAALLVLLAIPRPAQAAPTSLTYTGQLLTSLSPPTAANGSYDMQFKLFTAATGGSQAGPTVSVASVPVVGGVYYVQLNFGSVFTGTTYWIETSYRVHPASGSPPYTTISPRPIAPNSAFADYATLSGNTLALQGKGISATAPTTGQVLTYSGTAWAPAALPAPTAYTAGNGLTLSGSLFSVAVPLSLSGGVSGPVLQASNTGNGYGLYASSTAAGYAGVRGDDYTGGGFGVNGNATAGSGVLGSSSSGYGISGTSASSDAGHFVSAGGGNGVYGLSNGSGGNGVFGEDNDSAGSGVYGYSDSGSGVYGGSTVGAGVRGYDNNTGDYGLLGGVEPITGEDYPVGIFGYDATSSGFAIYGNSATSDGVVGNSGGSTGITGSSSSPGTLDSNGSGTGVAGFSGSGNGVYGASTSSTGGNFVSSSGYGLAGISSSNVGVYGNSGTGYAGYFQGNVHVTGSLSKAGGSFKIDHPLDPEHKYLYHSFVESPDMMNLYNGNVTTDAAGDATVTMPDWFQALNQDFRYQLTVIGQFAQAVVATEMQGNAFTIKTDKPHVKVSWMVTGIRHDAWANAHRIPVEEDKPAEEQGTYLHPQEWGQPENRGVGYADRQAHAARTPNRP